MSLRFRFTLFFLFLSTLTTFLNLDVSCCGYSWKISIFISLNIWWHHHLILWFKITILSFSWEWWIFSWSILYGTFLSWIASLSFLTLRFCLPLIYIILWVFTSSFNRTHLFRLDLILSTQSILYLNSLIVRLSSFTTFRNSKTFLCPLSLISCTWSITPITERRLS